MLSNLHDDDPILTTSEVARLLGVATSTVQIWMESGAIESWKTPGGHRRTRLSLVQGLMHGDDQARATPNPSTDKEYQPAPLANYPMPANERTRLAALAASGLVDTEDEPRFDRVVRLAAMVTGSPIALISLLTSTRQWFKARVGLSARETPRDWAFCSHTILKNELFVVEDALEDERFRTNPLVLQEPHIRFYAGIPLRDKSGQPLGSLCVIDREPRRLRAAEVQSLMDLADIAAAEIAAGAGKQRP
ncbi:GAF domain-containing protein [Massilia sp. TN1-12]|uniref:GAF domain-containing protein n=1 Tax=Massilia paldalensis TaxID=3377675 RepID=UPI00384BF8CD